MLWLPVKCANCADPDFQAAMQVICDCSNHIILDLIIATGSTGIFFSSCFILCLKIAWLALKTTFSTRKLNAQHYLYGFSMYLYPAFLLMWLFLCIVHVLQQRLPFWFCFLRWRHLRRVFFCKGLPACRSSWWGPAVRIMSELCILPSTVSLARWERSPACVAWHSYTASSANSAESICKLCSPDSGSPIKEYRAQPAWSQHRE